MTSIIKVDQIQNTGGTSAVSIDSSGIVNLSNTVMYDNYTLSSNFTSDGGTLSDWGKPSTSIYVANGVGALMSISSGIFTFPRTGVYRVSYFAMISNASSDNQTALSLFGTDDNSTYERVVYAGIGNSTSATDFAHVSAEVLVNVTNTSNRKIKLVLESANNGSFILGSSAEARTGVSFQWLSPTQT
tara:strand:- start:441 stop:1001 length:561 start_codon:yes stop_codon:yes gene_type:complete